MSVRRFPEHLMPRVGTTHSDQQIIFISDVGNNLPLSFTPELAANYDIHVARTSVTVSANVAGGSREHIIVCMSIGVDDRVRDAGERLHILLRRILLRLDVAQIQIG